MAPSTVRSGRLPSDQAVRAGRSIKICVDGQVRSGRPASRPPARPIPASEHPPRRPPSDLAVRVPASDLHVRIAAIRPIRRTGMYNRSARRCRGRRVGRPV